MSLSALKDVTFMQKPDAKPEAMAWLDTHAFDAAAAHAAPWVKALRLTARDVFAATGLPQPKTEGWQYTSLRTLAAENFVQAAAYAVPLTDLPAAYPFTGGRVVVLNGVFRPEFSDLPSGVEVLSLQDAARDTAFETLLADVGDLSTTPFKTLNTAFLHDGFVLRVAKGKAVAKPVEVLFANEGISLHHPRVLYWAGENAEVSVIERHVGHGGYFTNAVTMVEVEKAARLKFCRILQDAETATHMNHTTVRCGQDAVFEGFSAAIGGALLRQDFRLQLLGTHISATLAGIYMIHGQQAQDTAIVVDHFEPDGQSVQHFKGVVDDQARAIFQGKIHVHRPAQKTDGYQSHHALLLSRRAEANTKPELEIYADDVKCTHGATSGFLDQNALFYLRSRGIPEAEARALMVESFLNDPLQRISYDDTRAVIAAEVHTWLSRQATGRGAD